MNPVDLYAHAVVKDTLPAGKYHQLACARHVADRAREGTPDFPYVFHEQTAAKFFRFAELLTHYKGEWAGQPIRLEPWQMFILGSVFGWRHVETKRRRFRTAFVEIPRKNGKTLLAAIVLLYVAFFDDEPGAEGYSIATKRDQAKLVFNDAKQLILANPKLKTRIAVRVANLHREATASKIEPLGADHDSTDGLNPNVVIVDEMHAYKDRGLLDVLETATGARRQPLMYEITTFGSNPISPWGEQHGYACNILDGTLTDETFFTFTAHADPDDDWTAPATWRKANPNYGVSVNADDLASKALKAQGIPSASASFKQKHLNLLVEAFNPCLSIDGWRKGQSSWTPDALQHEPCYVGIDLSSRLDLTAVVWLFPPAPGRARWRVLARAWTPADTLTDRAHRDRAPYRQWVEAGWLTAVPGSSIDHEVVRAAILETRARYDIQQIGYDPWHAEAPIQNLMKIDGFDETQVIQVPQTFSGMSAGNLRLQAEIVEGAIDARGDPLLAWAVSNVVARTDGQDNLLFSKKNSRGRIDPIAALANAFTLATRHQAEPPLAMIAEWM